MECPHLSLTPPSSASLSSLASAIDRHKRELKPLECSVCGSAESVWVCASCGQFNCGRYVKGHGLAHFNHFQQGRTKHPLCMEAKETSVFCYLCDDFIINDDEKLQSLRDRLLDLNSALDKAAAEANAKKKAPSTPSSSSSSTPTPTPDRSLRPRRKRSSLNVEDRFSPTGASASASKSKSRRSSTGTENRPAKVSRRDSKGSNAGGGARRQSAEKKGGRPAGGQTKNLVGLRNLGNTCFMSAVLQSLGNIHEFCRVLKQLPALDGTQLSSGGSSSTPSSLHPASSASPSASSSNSETSNGYAAGSNSLLAQLSSGSSGERGSNKRETRSAGLTDGAIMTEELRKVLVALSQGQREKKTISPEALFHVIWKVVPRFRGYQQQDAHEFLRYMLDRLHTELLALLPGDLPFLKKSTPSSPYSRRSAAAAAKLASGIPSSHSLVTSVFGGTLQSEVTCLSCKTSSKKHDPFLDLSIDIPNQFSQLRASKAADKAGKEDGDEQKPRCHIHDCLQKFTDVEELGESERFFCGRCGRKQPSTKKFWIRRLPNVLCLHVKRFRWSSFSRTKIDTHVEFPLDSLDMTPYLLNNLHETRCSNAGSSLYDLAAVIVHHGSGAGSGHYTAFVVKDSHWYHFNDSNVMATDEEIVAKSKAYILFYIQREFRLPAPS